MMRWSGNISLPFLLRCRYQHRIEVYVPTHVALRMFIMQVLASQLYFLANRNVGLAIPPLFRPVICIKIGGHVALLSGPTVHSLYCGIRLVDSFSITDFTVHSVNGISRKNIFPVVSYSTCSPACSNLNA